MAYSEARLKDIAEVGQISQGSIYFHFGNKDDVARAVLNAQTERMKLVMDEATSGEVTGLDKLLSLFVSISELISEDVLVQGGIQLAVQAETGLTTESSAPYREWIARAEALINEGIGDGSVHPIADSRTTAEALTQLCIGTQAVSRLEDEWRSLPDRMAKQSAIIRRLLTGGQ